MKFHIEDYKAANYVMHVKNREEAKYFCDYLYKIGRKWFSGSSYKDDTNFRFYKEKTCYAFNTGSFCNKDWYNERSYKILEFDEFDWPEIKEEGKEGFLNEIEELLAVANEGLDITQKALEKIREGYKILKEELE